MKTKCTSGLISLKIFYYKMSTIVALIFGNKRLSKYILRRHSELKTLGGWRPRVGLDLQKGKLIFRILWFKGS